MSQAPSMPVFTDALIGDTTHLTTAEFGAYCLLLFVTWRNNGQPLPDDDTRLARVCRMTVPQWRKMRATLAQFFDLKDGTWRQKRLEREWNFAMKNREKKTHAANARWGGKSLENNETGDADGYADTPLPHMPPYPYPVESYQEDRPTVITDSASAAENGGGTPPSQVDQQSDPGAAEAIAAHFCAERDRLWPSNPNFPSPRSTLVAQAKCFLTAGASKDIVMAEVSRVMEVNRAKGDPNPPTSLRFCERSLATRITAHGGADHAPASGRRANRRPAYDPDESRRRTLAAFPELVGGDERGG